MSKRRNYNLIEPAIAPVMPLPTTAVITDTYGVSHTGFQVTYQFKPAWVPRCFTFGYLPPKKEVRRLDEVHEGALTCLLCAILSTPAGPQATGSSCTAKLRVRRHAAWHHNVPHVPLREVRSVKYVALPTHVIRVDGLAHRYVIVSMPLPPEDDPGYRLMAFCVRRWQRHRVLLYMPEYAKKGFVTCLECLVPA